jgi:hypothetical protein
VRVGWLGGFERETLDVCAICPSGSEARAGYAQSIAGREVVVGHLSKTACVHTQCVMLYRWKVESFDREMLKEIAFGNSTSRECRLSIGWNAQLVRASSKCIRGIR